MYIPDSTKQYKSGIYWLKYRWKYYRENKDSIIKYSLQYMKSHPKKQRKYVAKYQSSIKGKLKIKAYLASTKGKLAVKLAELKYRHSEKGRISRRKAKRKRYYKYREFYLMYNQFNYLQKRDK